jgi:hypothetical protein
MPKAKFPDEFPNVVINAEVDLGSRGGVLRFRTVQDVLDWIAAEAEFWAFLRSGSTQGHMGQWNLSATFFTYESSIRSQFDSIAGNWPNWIQNYKATLAVVKENPDDVGQKDNLNNWENKLRSKTDQFKGHVEAVLKQEIIDHSRHIYRNEPQAKWLKGFSEDQPVAVIYALDSLLLELQGSVEQRWEEAMGRTAATMFTLGYDPALAGAAQSAFGDAIKGWSAELAHFKEDFEGHAKELAALNEKHAEAWSRWEEAIVKNSEEMTTEGERVQNVLNDQIRKADTNLTNLTETYEKHMQLAGPMSYWKGKAKIHDARARRLKSWAIGVGIGGVVVMLVAAQALLPWHHAADTIPWRPIGLFLIVSTFALWMLRLVIKLLLSNIHLAVDAQERVVMINTFMALIRRPESAAGLAKEDIAIVLAPIFRPSTTGVIKDDGGPTSLGEFLTRLPSKE